MSGGIGHTAGLGPISRGPGRLTPGTINTHDCPSCGAPSAVHKSKVRYGTFVRTRICPQGHRFQTIEIGASAPKDLLDVVRWVCTGVVDQEMIGYIEYAMNKHLLGLAEPGEA